MQSFEVTRGHGKTLEDGGLKTLMEEEFGDVDENNNLYSGSFKALKSINVEFASITEIRVSTETNIEASPEDSLAAHQAYNRFMEAATGFNAKQRVDRAKAKAKKEAKAAAEKEMTKTKAETIPDEMHLLLEYLLKTKQTVFDFFKSIDLDESNDIDSEEFKKALANAEIADLPDWDIEKLVTALDLNADGKISPTELNLAFLKTGAMDAQG